jgi:organic hydroperoxide reductase OsmC/OhrA
MTPAFPVELAPFRRSLTVEMHLNAHEECFIANSVKTEVLCHPVVVAP